MSIRLKTITSINGKLVGKNDAVISVFDNSLLYAEGLFETMLTVDGKIMFLKEHLQRLSRGARVIGLKLPVNRETLSKWMAKTVAAHPSRVCKLRLTVTSGVAARWTGVQGKPQIILSASEHEVPVNPYRLQLSELRVQEDSVLRRIKTISYAIHAAALKKAQKKGADDALLLNTKGKVAEVTSANIFWVRRGILYTPPLSAGCLEGVTRKRVICEAKKIKLEVREKLETVKRLIGADELFITSSLKLVIGVSQIILSGERHRLRTGEVTNTLRERMLKIASL